MNVMEKCVHETLAQSDMVHIQRCSRCGCVSLHIGAVTIRLDDSGLEMLWPVIGEALAALQGKQIAEEVLRTGVVRGSA